TSVEAAAFIVGSRLTVPNASVLICASGTPSSTSTALVASIIAGGPQMCARRIAMFGTAPASSAASMAPTAPDRGSAPGVLMTTGDQKMGVGSFCLEELITKNEIARCREAKD